MPVRLQFTGPDGEDLGESYTLDDGTHVTKEEWERMNALSFYELRQANVSRVKRWHPTWPSDDGDWNIAEWTNALCGEAGEAANVAKKIRRWQTNLVGKPSDKHESELCEDLGDEIADVIIYADLVAAKLGFTLDELVRRKFNRTSEEIGFTERL